VQILRYLFIGSIHSEREARTSRNVGNLAIEQAQRQRKYAKIMRDRLSQKCCKSGRFSDRWIFQCCNWNELWAEKESGVEPTKVTTRCVSFTFAWGYCRLLFKNFCILCSMLNHCWGFI